jgi:cytoskeletal protein RodZ
MDIPVVTDAQTLKNLRTEAGLDIAQLAAMTNLSPGQVRQLEDGGDSNFYSPQIKAQSMRRVLRMLQNQPSAEDSQALSESTPKSVNVIDDIIRLSEKHHHNTIDTSLARRPGNHLKLTLGLGLVLVLVFVVLNWQANQSVPQKIFAEWVEPTVAKPVEPVPAMTEPLASVTPPPETAPQPVPPVAATAPPVPAAPAAPEPTVLAPVKEVVSDCKQLKVEPTPVAPVSVNKAGTYVYVLASKDMQVCVDDGKRVHTLVNLQAGQGKSIHGASPWVIGAVDMAALQVYFQGAKVLIPKEAGQRIVLKEQALPN